MRVCYFGTYSISDGYPRNRVLLKALQSAGITVIECHVPLWKDSADKLRKIGSLTGIIVKLSRIIKSYAALIIKFLKTTAYDVMIVGSIGHFDIFLAKILNIIKKKPIIFDAFISLYSTIAADRGLADKNSFFAKLLRTIDKFACKCADIVILDTEEHIEYFVKEFCLKKEIFLKIFIGADTDIFFPQKEHVQRQKIQVLFFGSFIPLHGISHILDAASILKNDKHIHFKIIGNGQEADKIRRKAADEKITNMDFVWEWLSEKEVAEHIAQSDICLGIFGSTRKAAMVIPCKIFDCIAMKKSVITSDLPAIKELLTDKKDVILCPVANAAELAEKIRLLAVSSELRLSIAQNAYNTFIRSASIEVIGKQLKRVIEELVIHEK